MRVRGLQALGEETGLVRATARVAVNLKNLEEESTGRGDALLTPDSFLPCLRCDVRIHGGTPAAELPRTAVAHIGSAAVPVHVRPLDADLVRLTLPAPLPLRIGDRAVLRDPGLRRVLAGLTVLDPQPAELRRRGSATRRAAELGDASGTPSEAAELRRRLLVRRGELTAMGVAVHTTPVAGDWLADPSHWTTLRARLAELVTAYCSQRPTEEGIPVEAARHRLGLPAVSLVEALVAPPLRMIRGRVTTGPTGLPAAVADAVHRLTTELADRPFAAPHAQRLAELGFGRRELAAAARHGAVLRLAEHVVLLPDAPPAGGRPAERTRPAVHRGNGEPRLGHHPTRHRPPAGALRRAGHHPTASRQAPPVRARQWRSVMSADPSGSEPWPIRRGSAGLVTYTGGSGW